jgi:hypothetical protein
MSFSFIENAR